MYLYLIRHAQSVNNAGEGTPGFQHVADAPLSPLGHQQAAHLAGVMRQHAESDEMQAALAQHPHLPIYRIDELYASPFRRTLQTAKPLSDALDMPVHVMMDIYEYGGIYQRVRDTGAVTTYPGLTRPQMREIVGNCVIPENVTDDGWWTLDVFEPEAAFVERGRRVAIFLKEQAKGAWVGKHIALISHADFTNLLMSTLLHGDTGRNPTRTSFIYPYNTSVTRFDFDHTGYPVLRYFSRVDHLPVQMVTF